jgi:transcriptional regulator with XRE-family HTH domain
MIAQRALEALSPELRTLADEMDVSYATVLAWKTGKRTPGPDNLRKLAAAADRQADGLRGLAVELRRVVSSIAEQDR